MEDLKLSDIKVVWQQMEKPDWGDFRSILENEKHKPEGIDHDLADKLIDRTYEYEPFPFPESPEELYSFLLKS
jgi:hypothetical protein